MNMITPTEDIIRKAIEQSLPAETCRYIQERLALCTKLEKDHAANQAAYEALTKSFNELRVESTMLRAENSQLVKFKTEVEAARVKSQIDDARVKIADEKVSFAERLVTAVFSNNRFKYREQGYEGQAVAIPRDQYGNGGYATHVQVPLDRTVEGEK